MRKRRQPARINVKVLVILLLAAGLLLGGAAVGYKVRKRIMARRALAAGEAALQKQDWAEACRQLKLYLSKYPNDMDMLSRYAAANLSVRPLGAKNIVAAIGAYRRLLRDKPGDDALCEQLAKLYLSVRDFSEAAYVCRERLKVDPSDSDAAALLGAALVAQGKDDQATEVLTALTQSDPREVGAYVMLSSIAIRADSPSAREDALRWLDQGVENNPQSARLRTVRARFHRTVYKDAGAARADLEAADALGPDDPAALLLLAEEWMYLGDLDRSQAELESLEGIDTETLAAQDADPDDLALGAFLIRGRLAMLRGAKVNGVELANRALAELSGRRRIACLPLAIDLYLAADRVDSARRCLDEYRSALQQTDTDRLSPRDDVALLTAVVANAEGSPHDAIRELEPLVAKSPENARAWMILGSAYEKTGRTLRAAMAWEEYLKRVPDDFATTLRVAKAYTSRDPAKALRYAARAEQLKPGDPDVRLVRIEARINAAATGSIDSATLREVSGELAALPTSGPEGARVRVLLAKIAAVEGRTDDAIAELERAIQEADSGLGVAMALAEYCKSAGRFDKGLDVCRTAIEQRPELARPRTLLAELHAANGRKKEARSTLDRAVAELTGPQRLAAGIALANFILRHGALEDGIARLRTLAAEHPENTQPRTRLLQIPEIRSDTVESQRLIDELRAIEGEQGSQWRVEQAKTWLRNGDWMQRQQAIEELLKPCIEADPESAEPVVVLGHLYERLRDDEKAERTYRRSLDASPGNVAVAVWLLALLERQSRFAEADAILQRLPARAPALDAHRVGIALGRGSYEVAIEELQKQTTANPDDAPSRVVLAKLIYGYRREAETALALLDEARSAAPDLRTVVPAKAVILHAEGREDEAVALLDAEVSRRNDFAAYLMRAEYYAATGQEGPAEKDYLHLTTLPDAGAEAYAALGGFYQKSGKLDQAIKAWRAGLDAAPNDPALQRMLASGLLASREPNARREGRALLDNLLAAGPDDPDLLFLHAAALVDEHAPGNTQEATEILERVVQADPQNAGAHVLLVRLALQQRDLRRADELLTRALGANPENRDFRLLRAGLEAELGHMTLARELARSVLERDSRSVGARSLLAELALGTGDIDSARRLNEEMVTLDPASETAQTMRARILEAAGQPDQAIEALESYCRTDAGRRSTAALAALADVYVRQQQFTKAEGVLAKAATVAPQDPAVCRARLRWLAAQDRFDDIVTALARRRDREPDPAESSVLVLGASLLASSGEDRYLREAKSWFAQAAALDPNRPEGHLGAAQVAYRLGETDAAENAYRRVMELDPYNRQALNDLAWILNEHFANPQEALELADKGITRYPDDPHLLDTRGVILMALGRLADARKDLERCLEVTEHIPSTRARALLHLGKVLVQQGELAAAKQRLDEALEIDHQHGVFTDEEHAEAAQLIDQTSPGPNDADDTM